jgi:hypothetical protein
MYLANVSTNALLIKLLNWNELNARTHGLIGLGAAIHRQTGERVCYAHTERSKQTSHQRANAHNMYTQHVQPSIHTEKKEHKNMYACTIARIHTRIHT